MAWPWLIAVIIGSITIIGSLAWYFGRRPHASDTEEAVWVANSGYMDRIPRFKQWVRRYRALQWAGVGALSIAVVATSIMAARPIDIRTTNGELASRDIVLCLDVSGSMIGYDQQVVEVFADLATSFEGERIALSIFNSTSRTMFPLTDDYALVQEQLEEAKVALDPRLTTSDDIDLIEQYTLFTAGTVGGTDGSSLIGDGLASCALLFDEVDTDRSRSIVFATDNDLQGDPIYSLQQAADLATDRDITVNGLFGAPSGASSSSSVVEEFRTAVQSTGGLHFFSSDTSAVESMVDQVQAQQAVDLGAEPEVTRSDTAGPWFLIATLGLIGLVLVQWRLRE
jgi:Ca-activated chloride channel homolog